MPDSQSDSIITGDRYTPMAIQSRIAAARGQSAAAITEEVSATLGTLATAVREGVQSRDGLERAVVDIRQRVDTVHALALEAQQRAMPAGTDAEALQAYQSPTATRSAVLQLDEMRPGDHIGHRTPLLATNDSIPVRMWSGYDECGDYRAGYLDDPAPRSPAQRDLQQQVELLSLSRAMGARSNGTLARQITRKFRRLPGFSRMFADNATEGAEWIPDTPGATLGQYMQLPREVAQLFDVVPIARNNMTSPFLSSGLQPFLAGQPASGDVNPANARQSTVATASTTYTTATLLVSTLANRDAEEDSIVAFGPFALAAIAAALQDAREDMILNGDTTASHGDTGLSGWSANGRWGVYGGTDDHRRGVIGLRHRALDDSATDDFDDGSISNDMLGLRGKLTAGFALSDLVYITSIEALIYHVLKDSNLLTVDKVGPLATVLTGQFASHGGIPIIISGFMSAELTSAGIYDNSTKTQTGMVLANRAKIKRPRVRDARTEIAVRPEQHVTYVVGSDREGLTYTCGSSEVPVAYGIDIANS